MNEIKSISHYSDKTARLVISNGLIAAKAQPGQFVIIKFSEQGQRIPFAIIRADAANDEIDVIIHRGDGLDEILNNLKEDDVLPDLLGPLGMPAVVESDKTVIFCGDGAGFVPLLPLMDAYREKGCRIYALMSELSSKLQCLLGDINHNCDGMTVIDEASLPGTMRQWIEQYGPDKIILSGPTMMMKELAGIAKEKGVSADCVLNMLIIDGIGICGVCRVMVGGRQKQTCVDGPVFNAWEVDFDYILNRQRSFI